ncbi:hypothetical protein [Gimesia fumaroli]|uniref:Uncharacterized protein n=1 Tax=Gimesia fumaroli TaxID=2527976 RepID=A0A518ID58_9PLAN|nr:hypothetical protein [Gimesia fumaroli]QDV50980.1 hypothetical protein Enr17x_30250 [Gimesia fumaroli]
MEAETDAYKQGKRQSELDVAQGCPRLYWGTRGSWGELLTRLMAERFQVTVQHVGCISTESQRAYERGYNKITSEYIDRTFGEGAFQEVMDEVTRYREESYRQYLQDRDKNE